MRGVSVPSSSPLWPVPLELLPVQMPLPLSKSPLLSTSTVLPDSFTAARLSQSPS